MREKQKPQALRKLCLGASIFPEEILNWIANENLWNIWVPKEYGGLELSLPAGLTILKDLAKIDGSMGWTVTLCSGANYFIGNLEPQAAIEIFQKPKGTILGGSGGVFGRAERNGDTYKISGLWRYATGAAYLTHFTLNAEIQENGETLKSKDGSPKVMSFVLPKNQVKIIEDWNTMGLKASVTHSFEVEEAVVHKRFGFIYNKFYQPQAIFRIPFSVFADLTLWVNYIGMAENFLEEAQLVKPVAALQKLKENIHLQNQKIMGYAKAVDDRIVNREFIAEDYIEEIHISASNSVKDISQNIIGLYPYLGVKASQRNHPLNHIFCDYFTATQHHIFTK